MSETAPGAGVAELVERTLRERIVAGVLPPDTPLRQDHISQEFRVSVACVREALRRLESSGLARYRPRHGVVVAPANIEDLWEILEIRLALESLALRAVIRLRSDQVLARLRALVPEGRAPDDPALWVPENREFHRAIAQAAAKPRLAGLIDPLIVAGDRYAMLLGVGGASSGPLLSASSQREHVAGYPARMRDHHRAIVTAVAQGRAADAVRALRADLGGMVEAAVDGP